MFYAHDGCETLNLQLQCADPMSTLRTFTLCDAGVHEGDWELVSVEVCPTLDRAPANVAYSAHGFNQLRRCAPEFDECTFRGTGADTWHPVSHVALGQHAQYPEEAFEVLLGQQPLPPPSPALNIVDSVVTSDDKVHVGTPENIVQLPAAVPTDAELAAIAAGSPVGADLAWVAYTGFWGVSNLAAPPLTPRPLLGLRCLNADHTALEDCPTVGLFASITAPLVTGAAFPPLSDLFDPTRIAPGSAPIRYNAEFEEWVGADNADLTDDTVPAPSCPCRCQQCAANTWTENVCMQDGMTQCTVCDGSACGSSEGLVGCGPLTGPGSCTTCSDITCPTPGDVVLSCGDGDFTCGAPSETCDALVPSVFYYAPLDAFITPRCQPSSTVAVVLAETPYCVAEGEYTARPECA